jgi:RHS repeat-associated protein
MELSETDLSFNGLGVPWGQTRSYDNIFNSDYDGPTGINWYVSQMPYLQGDGSLLPSSIYVVTSPTTRSLYNQDGTSDDYVPQFYQLDTLTYDAAANQFVFVQAATGQQLWFYGFDAGPKAGLLRALIDPAGNIIPAAYDAQGRLVSMARVYEGEEAGFYYTYVDGESTQLASAAIQSGGVAQRQANYTYYGSGDPNGLLGDLQSVVIEQWNATSLEWETIKTSYYRYYTSAASPGFEHGLKYVVGGQAYAEMVAAGLTPETATDAQVAMYADNYFEYDSSRRVTLEETQGGAYSSAFVYETNGLVTSDFNQWVTKTTETLTDGSTNIVYCNMYAQALFKIYQSGSDKWYEWWEYDDDGNTLQLASSSAISGYDESTPSVGVLNSSSGLITVFEYYTEGDFSGQPPGYAKSKSVQQGSSGTPVLLQEWTYASQTLGSQSVYPIAGETIYQSTSGTLSPALTEYAYEWYPGTFQKQQVTTTWPAILTSQNGSGTANSQTTVYDPYGNPIWLQDERGFLTNYTNDPITGTVIQIIQDVDTSILPAPNGWTTPSGGGLHLITDYLVDVFGRTTQSLGPENTIDLDGTATELRQANWYVYQDADHAIWTGSGYATGSSPSYTFTLINPVTIQQNDVAGRSIGQIQATRSSPAGPLLSTDSFPQSSWTRWSATNYAVDGTIAWQRTYFLIPSSGNGTSGTNYNETDFAYDSMGRQIKTVTPAGTITRQVLNPKGWILSTWVGTNDTGATPSDPTGGGSPGNNMVQVGANVYDGGSAGGDGNLTQVTQYASGSDTRVTSFGYDFRDRRTYADGEIDFYQTYTYDNVNRLLQTDNYNTSSSGNLVARQATAYDNLGRVYSASIYGVDPSTGTVGNALVQNTWYDPSGNIILSQNQTNQGFTKNSYDGINRLTATYAACNTTAQTYATASTAAADTVVQQTINTYDAASNLIFQATSQRFHNATGTGALNGPSGAQPESRVSYLANYPDPLGRVITSANYGTNLGSPVTRPDVAPSPSDTILVSYNDYNAAGYLAAVTDPEGTVTQSGFDAAGRLVQQVQNYQSSGSGPDINKTTSFTYNANGQIGSLTASNSTTGNQVTQWVYGTAASDSGVVSNELLHAKVYPDDGEVIYGYNRLGRVTQRTDQNETVRQFTYDKLGRLSADTVTTLGSGVDGAIRKIGRTYEVRGLLQNVTSYDGSGSVVNDVQMAYNTFQQLQTDYQAHSGAVNTSTTPNVAYAYADGSDNTVRPESITYPNGRVLNYGYGTTDSIDDLRDRVTGLSDSESLVSYTYFGLDTTVVVGYVEPSLQMTYIKQGSEPVGDGGDQYTGLDRFNRVIDIRWINPSGTAVNRFKYGYSEASNRLWRQNPVASGGGFDEQYEYDGLYQVYDRALGTLWGITIPAPVQEEQFTYDPTGNWSQYELLESGTVVEDQTREHQQSNEITEINGSSATVGYDANGNMTTLVSEYAHPVWDAWNRLVAVEDYESPFATYQYDGLNRRILKLDVDGRDYYYSNQWQVLEERIAGTATAQYVWGVRYEDDLVLRDENPGEDEERLYALADYYQPTAIATTSGTVVERYVYTAFGTVSYYNGSFESIDGSAYGWTYLYGSYQLDPPVFGESVALYQVRNRYYNAELGRWLSRDPLQEAELSQGTNLYWYVSNNAVNAVDPKGNSSLGGYCQGTIFIGRGGGQVRLNVVYDFCQNKWCATFSLSGLIGGGAYAGAGLGGQGALTASCINPGNTWSFDLTGAAAADVGASGSVKPSFGRSGTTGITMTGFAGSFGGEGGEGGFGAVRISRNYTACDPNMLKAIGDAFTAMINELVSLYKSGQM